MFRTLLVSICYLCSVVSAQTPSSIELAKILATDGSAYDYFGYSVSVSGDTAIVGAYRDDDNGSSSGSAYIYQFDGSQWTEVTKLLASDGASGDYFGRSVSISGDTAIVGAYYDDDNGSFSGSAYIYRFDGSQWTEVTKLLASDGASGDYFGLSVSISGDTAIVGAYYDDDNGSSSGSAYIYRFDGSQWIEVTKLLASDGASSDYFGRSVSISGDTAIVGAYYDDDNGSSSGSAYIYQFDGSQWTEVTKLLASDGASGDYFGRSVSISGDTAIVGAYYDDDNGSFSGSAYIYRFDGSQWTEVTKLLASDGASGDYFGLSVSISGDTAIVGAEGDDGNESSSGSAYIYNFDGSQWTEVTKLLASDGKSSDYFGRSVSISGDTAIVGAYGDDGNEPRSGAGYVFIAGIVDCNGNGVEDSIDVKSGFSYDCDQNGVPDECQPDCDGDGFIDPCDNEGDCDDDGIPDNCETDCQPNGIPDDCDIAEGNSEDVNEDGIPDECQDCNNNGVLDSEDIENGTSNDVDGNGIPDECQIPVTWTVDDDGKADFYSIADAVAMAGFFDEIIVYPGTYTGLIDISNKQIWLHSSDGPETTVIDGGETVWGIKCHSGGTNETRIEGFTITNCYGEYPYPGGMSIAESSPMISNCIFDSNSVAGNGGGINCTENSFPVIAGCKFINNSTSANQYPGGGIVSLYGSNPYISDTLFCGNFPDQISGSWTDSGGTCISILCDDDDGDGWPNQCGIIGDGIHHVPEEFATIQQAINAAGDHDEIIVAPGVYNICEETMSFYDAVMNPLGKRLWIHSSGGQEVTIIESGNCFGGVFTGETNASVIEGFTFRTSTIDSWTNIPINLFLSSPSFKNCIFISEENSPPISSGITAPTFENCTFDGIGIDLAHWQGSFEVFGTVGFIGCMFKNIESWQLSQGSGVRMHGDVGLILDNCIFEENTGTSILYISDSSNNLHNKHITNCTFRNNVVSGGQFGGEILHLTHAGEVSISNSIFENNESLYALYWQSTTSSYAEQQLVLSNVIIRNNSGVGIRTFSFWGEVEISNSRITSNLVGGLSLYYGDVTLINTTVCDNTEFQISGDYVDGGQNIIAEVCNDDCFAADVTGDSIVNVDDLLAVVGYWGSSLPGGDANDDGIVDITDLLAVIGNWGSCE